MSRTEAYEPREYWAHRLAKECSLATVGLTNAGRGWNRWLYAVRRAVLLRTMRKHAVTTKGRSVLELGVGSGFYVPIWEKLGASCIVGVDLTEHSVSHLEARHPRHTFTVQDIGVPFDLGERFDLVTAFDVMFHIVDDASHQVALANAVKHVAPGGYLLLTDIPLQGAAPITASHVRLRPLWVYDSMMRRLGMRFICRAPIFLAMAPPLNLPPGPVGRILSLNWRFVSSVLGRLRGWQRDAVGHLGGALLFPLEVGLTASARAGTSIELLVWQRPGGSSSGADWTI